ncbi:MAG TPA: hypothetical protein VGI39_20350 [Polyangiaceae bacterium]|jgi:hypothetical protein
MGKRGTQATGRRVAFLGSLVLLFSIAAACDKNPFESDRPAPAELPPQTPASPGSHDPGVSMDGAAPVEHADPPSPAGDLREDAERFTTLDTCVAQHPLTDPLVGDAVRSIGYDTLIRDACRLLQAIKLKDPSPCFSITASGLQQRCSSLLAESLKDPEKCPWASPANRRLGRDPSCLAITTHDPRSCAAELESLQPLCEAQASSDVSRCSRAMGEERQTCARDLQRVASLLAGEYPAHSATPVTAHLEIHGAKGTPDPASTDVDLGATMAGGAVVAAEPTGGIHLALTRENDSMLGLSPHGERAHLQAIVSLEGGAATLKKFDLLMPKVPELVCPSAHCTLAVTLAKADPTRGAALSASIEGEVETPTGSYTVHLKIETFVRDVVSRSAIYGGR